MLLGFQRLVQAFRIAPSRHHAAGEFVDDDDGIVLDDIILVAMEQLVGLERLLDVVNDGDVLGVVKVGAFEQTCRPQHLLEVLVALFGQGAGALFFVEFVVFGREFRHIFVDGIVEVGLVVDRPRDDERCARFVNENRVDFVNHREAVATLHHLRQVILHVVAEIVETQLVVGGIGDVCRHRPCGAARR